MRFEVIREVDAIDRLGETVVASGDHIQRDLRPKSQMGCHEHKDQEDVQCEQEENR